VFAQTAGMRPRSPRLTWARAADRVAPIMETVRAGAGKGLVSEGFSSTPLIGFAGAPFTRRRLHGRRRRIARFSPLLRDMVYSQPALFWPAYGGADRGLDRIPLRAGRGRCRGC